MSHLFTLLVVIGSLFNMLFPRDVVARSVLSDEVIFSAAPKPLAVTDDVQFTVDNPTPPYTFGDQVTFKVTLQTNTPIADYYISYQSEGKSVQTQQLSADTTSGASGSSIITYNLDLHNGALRPFSNVTYWFQVKTTAGTPFTSPHFSFFYEDNRFTWQTLANDHFTIHWANGDITFAQDIQNAAEQGLEQIQTLIPVTFPNRPIDIYVYAKAADLQSALDLSLQDLRGSMSWVAGDASPDLGVVMVSIAPGVDQRLTMDQQIPHELAHVLTYQLTGPAYTQLPVWLTEGIASMAELYPNSDYAYSLQMAVKNNNLIPMANLCREFPNQAAPAFLAYAQADSFSHYLYANYGVPGMQKLIQKYVNGLGCSEGATAALGMSLNSLEYRWKQDSLKMDTTGLVWRNLLPYIILVALILILPLTALFIGRKKPAPHRPAAEGAKSK